MHPFSLAGETALITGGGSGIGLAIARAMAEAGARVVLAGRREDALREAATGIGAGAAYLVHDVNDAGAASDLLKKAAVLGEAPTILVNNAGIHLKKPALDTTPEEFNAVMQTHVTGGFALSRAAAPAMLARGAGSILFVSSMAALFGIPQVIAYSSAKSAMTGLIRSLAVELSPGGVRVNGIAPGWIETAMMRGAVDKDPARRDRILARTPMHKFGLPEDIGMAAVYLSSTAAKFVTGTLLPVDGGISIGF